MRSQFRRGKLRWQQTRTTPRATPLTHGLSARQLSIWHEAWTPPDALLRLWDGNDLTETELLELVEYGQLHVVGPEWLAEVPSGGETEPDDAGAPGHDSPGVSDAEDSGGGDGNEDPDRHGAGDDVDDPGCGPGEGDAGGESLC